MSQFHRRDDQEPRHRQRCEHAAYDLAAYVADVFLGYSQIFG